MIVDQRRQRSRESDPAHHVSAVAGIGSSLDHKFLMVYQKLTENTPETENWENYAELE